MKTSRLRIIILIVTIGLCIGAISIIRSQSSKANRVSNQKWEYCAIENTTTLHHADRYVGTTWIRFFEVNGSQLRAVSYSFNSAKDFSDDYEYMQKWKREIQEKEGIPQTIELPKRLSHSEAIELVKKESLSKAMAQLGDESWELTEKGNVETNSSTNVTLYFKRPQNHN
jgi:hypothetical protein